MLASYWVFKCGLDELMSRYFGVLFIESVTRDEYIFVLMTAEHSDSFGNQILLVRSCGTCAKPGTQASCDLRPQSAETSAFSIPQTVCHGQPS